MPARGDLLAGRYRVLGELGRGGWGVVLAVTDEHQRALALKLLIDDASDEALRRFAREAEVIRSLHSAHVCRIHDTGTLDDGSPYIVMDRLVGHDLDVVLGQRGPLPIVEAVDYVMQACDAIAEAHLNGVVHRDIKPSNLFLARTADGDVVKVLDFGIAKARRVDLKSLTGTGMMLGSPYYMAPEQLVDSREVDGRTDIWALGVTLFELVAGEPCFRGDDVGTLFTAVLRDPPIPLTQLRPDAPQELASAIARCLEKDPEDRYDGVASLADALAPFGSDRARVLTGRIRALTFRRMGSRDPAGTTALYGSIAASSTAVMAQPAMAATGAGSLAPPTAPLVQPTLVTPPGRSPAPSPPYPPPQPTSVEPATVPGSRRKLVAIIGAACALALVVAATITVAAMRSGVGPCRYTTCDLTIADFPDADPATTQAVALRVTDIADAAKGDMRMYLVTGMKPDGTLDATLGTVTMTFVTEREVTGVTVTEGGAQIHVQPLLHPTDHTAVDRSCTFDHLLATVRKRQPNAELIVVTRSTTAAGTTWSANAQPGRGHASWLIRLSSPCQPLGASAGSL